MAVRPEGTPCWADVTFPDVEAAKHFYGELLGWTYDEGSAEFGNYTQAYSDGKAVAAVVPRIPGVDSTAAWNLYFATADASATTARIRENGGTPAMDPVRVGDFGTMVTAQDPSGVYFSAWQAGSHEGFEKTGEPGAYAWVDIHTREARKADSFFPSVFPFQVQRMDTDEVDFHLWSVGGEPVAGRLKTNGEVPAGLPPFANVYFAVRDCDAAVHTVTELGGLLLGEPMDSPFGRSATVADQQGAVFSVIDLENTKGEMPSFS